MRQEGLKNRQIKVVNSYIKTPIKTKEHEDHTLLLDKYVQILLEKRSTLFMLMSAVLLPELFSSRLGQTKMKQLSLRTKQTAITKYAKQLLQQFASVMECLPT